MKVIDEKGMLFGKINVIDFLAVIVLFGCIPMFYFGYKIMSRKPIEAPKGITEMVEIEIHSNAIKLKPEILELVKLGDKETDENGVAMGEIIWIGKSRPYQHKFDVGVGQIQIKDDLELSELPIKFKLRATIRDQRLYYKDTQILIGSPIQFITGQYALTVMPAVAEMDSVVERMIKIKCRIIEISPGLEGLILEGDEAFNINSERIGKIISIGKMESYLPNSYAKEQGVANVDSDLKQAFAIFMLRVELREGSLYYDGMLLSPDLPFDFKTNKYAVTVIPDTWGIEKIDSIETAMGRTPVLFINMIKDTMIDASVTLKNLSLDVVKLISVGDKELDRTDRAIAEIMELGNVENNSVELNLGGQNFTMVTDSVGKQLTVRMRLRCKLDTNNRMYFKGVMLTSDSLFEFKTDKYTVEWRISKAYETFVEPLKEKWVDVKVKFSGVIPELASVMSAGDTEKEPSGKVVGRLNKIIESKASEILTLKESSFIPISHPFNKDVLSFLNIRCIEKEGILYFKNYPLKIGNALTFTTNLYSVSGTVVGIDIK